MARIVADRVLETTTSTGTSTLTLLGAVTGFVPFSSKCANLDTFTYYIEAISGSTPSGDWETGIGSWGTGNILTRTTVIASSNSNTLVNFTAGTKRVGIGLIANGPYGATGGAGNAVFFENDQTVTSDYTLTEGKNAMTAGPIVINTGVTVTIPTGATWSVV